MTQKQKERQFNTNVFERNNDRITKVMIMKMKVQKEKRGDKN
jgi:hypothetical protein